MKFAVKVHNEFLSRAIQELAFENGCGWIWTGRGYVDKSNKYPNGDCVLFFDDTTISCADVDYAQTLPHYTLFDAKTDWDKIEQAMKPKEPRVIWVNEYLDCLGSAYTSEDKAKAVARTSGCIRTIKFQEVIE